ncbi:MAG: Veg family protein [Clostridiales bacterium]|nr:Veg family protein [Candidatus Apopatousia equi]
MKVNNLSVEQVKKNVDELKGKQVVMAVNKGRKHIVKFNAEVVATYPSVFTVEAEVPNPLKTMSYAYSEILCGNVKILSTKTSASNNNL